MKKTFSRFVNFFEKSKMIRGSVGHRIAFIWLLINSITKTGAITFIAVISDSHPALIVAAIAMWLVLSAHFQGLPVVFAGDGAEYIGKRRVAHRVFIASAFFVTLIDIVVAVSCLVAGIKCEQDKTCYDSCMCFVFHLPTSFALLSLLTADLPILYHTRKWLTQSGEARNGFASM